MIGVGKSSKLFFCGYPMAKFKPRATTMPVEPSGDMRTPVATMESIGTAPGASSW